MAEVFAEGEPNCESNFKNFADCKILLPQGYYKEQQPSDNALHWHLSFCDAT